MVKHGRYGITLFSWIFPVYGSGDLAGFVEMIVDGFVVPQNR